MNAEGGADISSAPPPRAQAVRIRRSREVFAASDGNVYLIKLGTGEDLVVREPTDSQRELLERLAVGFIDTGDLLDSPAAEDIQACLDALEAAGVLEYESPTETCDQRFDRQLIYLADLAPEGCSAQDIQARLGRSSVVMLGCGGPGTWLASGLALAGIGRLTLIDHDHIELSNLNRQVLYTERDLGRPKVEVAAEALQARNSNTEIVTHCLEIRGPQDLSPVIAGADLVVATADWPPHLLPRWVNEACVAARVPFITAGQFPPVLRVGPMVIPGRSPCLECLEIKARRDFPLYEELGQWRSTQRTPDASVGPVSAVIGSLLATEAFHLLAAADQLPASVGNALILDLSRMTLRREPVSRQPDCGICAESS